MHRRLNENLDEPIPLPTMRFPYARNEKALLVDSLVQIRTRLSKLAGPSTEAEQAPKRGKAGGAGRWFVPTSVEQPNLDSRAGPKHAAIMALSNSQEEYLANLNRYQHGTGKETKEFKDDVQLAVTGFFSHVPEDRPEEVEQAIQSSLLDPDEYEANLFKYDDAVEKLKEQLERIKRDAQAPLMKVPESVKALFKSVETSLLDRRMLLDELLNKVQGNLERIRRKGKRPGCVVEIARLAINKKRAAFFDPDHAHHKATRMAVHLEIVGKDMEDVRMELIKAATIDGQALAERRDAYHNKQNAKHAEVCALVDAEVVRRRSEHIIAVPKPRNLVGEVITNKKSAEYQKFPTAEDLRPLHEERAKARQQIFMRYPEFNRFATEARREKAERKRKQEAAAEAAAEAARKAAEAATLATLRKRTADRREGVHTATEACLQKVAAARAAARAEAQAEAEAKALAQKIREVDATDEWL